MAKAPYKHDNEKKVKVCFSLSQAAVAKIHKLIETGEALNKSQAVELALKKIR